MPDPGGPVAPDPNMPATTEPPTPTRLDAAFGAMPPDPAMTQPVEPTMAEPPAPTRLDAAFGAVPPGPAEPPDPYASRLPGAAPGGEWPPPPEAPADQWQAADTVYVEPAQAAGSVPPYAPPSPTALGYQPLAPGYQSSASEYRPSPTGYPPSDPAYRPPAPATPGRQSGGRGSAVLIIVVIVVALGAGGGAYALTRSHGHAAGQPPASPIVTARASSAAPAVDASASTAGSATAGSAGAGSAGAGSAGAAPATSPAAPVTPSPARTGTVRVAAVAAGNPAEPRVEAYLNRYFSAINTRNYGAYQGLLDAQEQQANSRSTFDSGYATTKDSNEVLTGIEDTGGGNLTANVSFTSRQNPANSVDGRACNNWRISLYLAPRGSSYVMTAAPAGYHAQYTDC
jgi:hypothetical protein